MVLRLIIPLFAVTSIGLAFFFYRMDEKGWATVEQRQSLAFGDVTLRVVETGAAADLDELRGDPLLGRLFVTVDEMLRTETARGYGMFDPDSKQLTLFVAGEATRVLYDPEVPVASVSLPGAGPIEVHWAERGLRADVVVPVILSGAPSEWAFQMPLMAAADVGDMVAAQEKIITDALAAKTDWRERMTALAEEHADDREFKTDTNDVWLSGWQATLSYPEDARFSPIDDAFGGRVHLADDQIVNIGGYRTDVADKKNAEFRAIFEAFPEDEKLLVRDTDDLLIAVRYDRRVSVIARVDLENITYVVSAALSNWDDIGVVVAIADSISQRPLGAPSFDPLTITREEMRIAMGLPPFKIGPEYDLDPTSSARSDLETMLRPEYLISSDSTWSNPESTLWLHRIDGDGDSILMAEIECFTLLGTPESAAAIHDSYIARTAFDPKLMKHEIRLMNYINDGGFASNAPFQPYGEFETIETPDFAPEWFVDTPSYAFGAYGPYYVAYRVDQLGDVSIFCATHDHDSFTAWMKMDLHGDVERPAPVALAPDIKAQFAAYPAARAFGPGYYTVDREYPDPMSYLIAGDGTLLISKALNWWKWHEQTQTITAEDADDKVGLYLVDGTKILPHAYEDIDTWPNLGPTVMWVREEDGDLFYDLNDRAFVPDPTQ
ncbi:hypothetical protein [Tritonibacter scottomollicae]|uniref:Uncharacterized protein n=1 Tax=Tritonibacter scottomollicae TaxID=483013 RepID=A0A2T0ZYJ7_TRISK|nr:hypothetical protein [Tritonibacter scottomollicae]PRZ41429.1 hypothetical protein CLV89_1481 [Tritonibacter scottomollicae]